MTGEELQAALFEFYGEAWLNKAVDALGLHVRTLERQVDGHSAVAGPVAAWVHLMRENRELRHRKAVREKRSKDKARVAKGGPDV